MYEPKTSLCTYWIPEIVEPTSSNKLKKGFQEIQVCSSFEIAISYFDKFCGGGGGNSTLTFIAALCGLVGFT